METTKMTAKLAQPKKEKFDGAVREKEYIGGYTAVDPKDGREVVTLRLYVGRSSLSSRIYAAIWVSAPSKSLHLNGTGWAGSGGYDKKSAAASEAMSNAGVELSQHISGVGDPAVREAVEAIGRAAGYRRLIIVNHYA